MIFVKSGGVCERDTRSIFDMKIFWAKNCTGINWERRNYKQNATVPAQFSILVNPCHLLSLSSVHRSQIHKYTSLIFMNWTSLLKKFPIIYAVCLLIVVVEISWIRGLRFCWKWRINQTPSPMSVSLIFVK